MSDQAPEDPQTLPIFDHSTTLAIWITSILVVVLFGVYAIIISRVRSRKEENSDTLEFFVTARGTSPMWRVVWSFLAGSAGAWVLSSPPGYAQSAGVVGMVFYSLASGIPIILLALLGDKIQKMLPKVLGFTHYVEFRYGKLCQFYVTLIICFNTGIAMTAEYTAIGDIFQDVAGINRIPIVIVIGVVSMVYTAVGGLYASLITDQAQAIFSSILLGIVVIYIAVVFRAPLGPLPEELQPKELGYHSIVAMPISLFCATVFSEGPWQRVWASQDSRSLKTGACIATVLIILTIFLYSFFGFLAIWAGYASDKPNLLLFQLLTNGGDQSTTPSWLVVIIILLAVTMSESAVDSQQNGVIDCLSTVFFKGRSANWARIIVIIINIPVIIVSLKGYSVINLFQIANLVTTTATLPFLIGLWEPGYEYFDGLSALFGCIFSLICVIVYGGCTSSTGVFSDGVRYVFFEAYEAYPFVIGLFASGVGMLIWVAMGRVWRVIGLPAIKVPGLTPGYIYETAPSSPGSPPKYVHEGLN
jgi:Na+/proline symporter